MLKHYVHPEKKKINQASAHLHVEKNIYIYIYTLKDKYLTHCPTSNHFVCVCMD